MESYEFDCIASALEQIAVLQPDVILADWLPTTFGKRDGAEILSCLRENAPDLPIVLMAARDSIPALVQFTLTAADTLIEKPSSEEQLIAVLTNACEQRISAAASKTIDEQAALSSRIESTILGRSAEIRGLRNVILKLAPTPASVIIFGETGTGKEMVAQCLHEFSGRKGPFVAINCAAIPEHLIESEMFGHEAGAYTGAAKQRIGKIEYSNGGTLFLDEIETMPLYFQAKLLRVLQERKIERLGSNKSIPVDLRIITATKVDLKECSAEGKFRSDLFYRLNVAKAKISPLRERREDITMLFEHFIQETASRFAQPPVKVSRNVQQQLLTYDWPGNVRELRNTAEQLQLGIPLSIGENEAAAAPSLDKILAAVEKALINDALLRHDGAANTACTELQINYSTLYRKMKQYDMDLSNYR